MPYVTLARLLADGDRPRAVELLEQALARPVRDLEHWDLPARLRELRGRG